ncbi:28705_t:CDS:1, partial [Gigaspora margarita]
NNIAESEFISDTEEEEAGANMRKCKICGLRGHNARTCSDFVESDGFESESVNNEEVASINKRKCRICGLGGHNAQICPNFLESNATKITESISDTEEDNMNK